MIELGESTKDEVNHRAYALYLMRGCEQGRDVEDWIRAEKELNDESVGEQPPRARLVLASYAILGPQESDCPCV